MQPETVYPYVIPEIVEIPEEAQAYFRTFLNDQRSESYDITLSNGPFWVSGELSLHANEGPILKHRDGAGITFGLILVADGEHHLLVDNTKLPLRPGTFFAINSNDYHATASGQEDLIAFATIDFYHEEGRVPHMSPAMRKGWTLLEPHIAPTEFAEEAHSTLTAWSKASA